MSLRIDDLPGFLEGLPDDVLQQVQQQAPDLFAQDQDPEGQDSFGFGDAFSTIFNSLNPNANFGSNLWNASSNLAEEFGLDLGPLGALSPGANLAGNAMNVAKWAVNQIDFDSVFGGIANSGQPPTDEDEQTTLFTTGGDPVTVSNSLVVEAERGDTEAVGEQEEQSVTAGVEDFVSSLFDEVFGFMRGGQGIMAGESIEQMVAKGAKRLAQRAISRVIAAL